MGLGATDAAQGHLLSEAGVIMLFPWPFSAWFAMIRVIPLYARI